MGKILIIDDEKQMLALLSRILELEGYEVYRTATCKAGLRQLQVNTPEVDFAMSVCRMVMASNL